MVALKPNQVIVIQRVNLGGYSAKRFLDDNGIESGRNYSLFNSFDEKAMGAIENGLRQLVFTSHNGMIDSAQVAKDIKSKNPNAVVAALFSNSIGAPNETSSLDGVIVTSKIRDNDLASLIARFAEGASQLELVQMIRQLGAQFSPV